MRFENLKLQQKKNLNSKMATNFKSKNKSKKSHHSIKI